MVVRKLLAIAVTDLRLSHSAPSVLITRILVPITLILVIGLANGAFQAPGGEAPRRTVHVYLPDETSRLEATPSQALIERLTQEDSRFDFVIRAEPVDTGPLIDGNVSAVLVIPEGFSEAVDAGRSVTLRLLTDDPAGETAAALTPRISRAAREVAAVGFTASWAGELYQAAKENSGALSMSAEAFAADAAREARSLWAQAPVRVDFKTVQPKIPERSVREWGGGFQQSVPGMGSMYVMFAVLAGVGTLVWERKNGTLQRVVTMPVGKGTFIGGKVIARMLIGLGEFVIAFAAGAVLAIIAPVEFGGAPGAILLTALAFSFFTSALALFMATLVTSPQQASSVTMLLALTLAPLGGAWWSLDFEFIPQIMRDLALVSPFYWAMEGFKEAIMYAGGIADVLIHSGVLLATGLVLFAAAVLRFRYP